MCETIDPGSCRRWVLGFGIKTGYDSNSPNATTADKKRGAKIDRPHSSIEQVHCEAGTEKFILFQCLMQIRKSGVGARIAKGIWWLEAVPSALANFVKSRVGPIYFEAHTIRVLMNQPLHDIFGNRDSFGRIRKWVTELSKYVINFKRRSAIKS
jgi:hypothetical protein